LLSRRGALPLVRVQPVHFQGTIDDAWKPTLERLQQREPPLFSPDIPAISQAAALHA